MNRNAFLKELRRELDVLPFEERENAVTYYEEYFDEAGPAQEQETIAGLGTPAEIAAELKVGYAVNQPPKTPREGAVKVWMIILAIFAAPFALPLAIALAAIIFSLFIVIISVIFSIGVTAFALILSGIVIIIAGFAVIAASPATTLFFLGSGAAILGIGALFGYCTYIVATKLMGAFARLLGRILDKVKARKSS